MQEQTFFEFPTIFSAQNALSSFFNDMTTAFQKDKKYFPYPINIITYDKNNDSYMTIIEIALAGISKDEIKISTTAKMLNIKITPNNIDMSEDAHYMQKNISTRNGEISYRLHPNADVNNIKVSYENGLLRITVPKKEQIDTNEKLIEIE